MKSVFIPSHKNELATAVVVVKWSACLTSTPTIRVRIPMKPKVFFCKFVFEKNENKAGVGRIFFKKERLSLS